MIHKGRKRLILNHGFFAQIILQLEMIEDESIGTAGITKDKLTYSKSFVNSLDLNSCEGLLAHEALHLLLLHHVRGIGKDPDDWNKACDYAINPMLLDSGFTLPKDGLYKPEFKGMDAGKIYKIIHKEGKEKENQQSNGNGQGNGKSDIKPQDWGKVIQVSENEKAQAEAEAKQMTIAAMNATQMMGKEAGKMPGGLKEMIIEIIEPKKNWKELLQKYAAEIAYNDYSWSRPNKRYIQMGLYMPSLRSTEIGNIVLAIDTSGSIDRKLFSEFISEIKEIIGLFNSPVTIIHCDTEIRKIEELEEDKTDIV